MKTPRILSQSFFTKLKEKLTSTSFIISMVSTLLLGIASRYIILHYYDIDVLIEIFSFLSIGHYAVLALFRQVLSLYIEHLGIKSIVLSMNGNQPETIDPRLLTKTDPVQESGNRASAVSGGKENKVGQGGSLPATQNTDVSSDIKTYVSSSSSSNTVYLPNKSNIRYDYDRVMADLSRFNGAIKGRLDNVERLHEDVNSSTKDREMSYNDLLSLFEEAEKAFEKRKGLIEDARKANDHTLKARERLPKVTSLHTKTREILAKYEYMYKEED